jgi:hypothetical protein
MRAAYKANIETLTWMGPETRAKALTKLAALRPEDRLSRQVEGLLDDGHRAGRRAWPTRVPPDLWSWRFNVNKLGSPWTRTSG